MVRVNKIQFPIYLMSWEMSKMTSSALLAEQHIIEATEDISFEMDGLGNVKTITQQSIDYDKLQAMKVKSRKLLEDEHFDLFLEMKEIYFIKINEYNKKYGESL